MLYVDEDLIAHPKMLRAGELLGGPKRDGLARAVTLWLAGYSYAAKFMTDGVVPLPVVEQCVAVREPRKIASVLDKVGLWHSDPAGWRMHDFDVWNKPAEVERKKRDQGKARSARWRARRGGNGHA